MFETNSSNSLLSTDTYQTILLFVCWKYRERGILTSLYVVAKLWSDGWGGWVAGKFLFFLLLLGAGMIFIWWWIFPSAAAIWGILRKAGDPKYFFPPRFSGFKPLQNFLDRATDKANKTRSLHIMLYSTEQFLVNSVLYFYKPKQCYYMLRL